MRLLTGENGPGFCKLSKSRIDRDRNGRENVGRLGASAGAGWGACWPGAVLGWPFWGGVRSIYDFDGKNGRQAGASPHLSALPPFVLFFSLFGCPRVLLLALAVRSGRTDWRHRGGGRWRVRLAVVLGVSCVSYGRRQGGPLSCRVCWPSPLLAVLGQSVRVLVLALGMGGDPRPTGLLIGKMHKDSIRNAA